MPETELQSLETALRSFEPLFWLMPPGEPTDRLYDPDGTLYAICLDGPAELCTDRRRVAVNRGDLVIIPPAVAIDVSPQARWLGLSYTGPYPYHFRERFIQVWGFEHHALDQASNSVLLEDYRHRLSVYLNREAEPFSHDQPSFQLAIKFNGGEHTDSVSACWAMPGEPLAATPEPFDYYISIPAESYYLVNREAHPQPRPEQTMSPEYRPGQG
ncbi:MAG: hypothetical protein ACKO0V_06295 [bacterium]